MELEGTQKAAAFHGSAMNVGYSGDDRLMMALAALEIYEAEYVKLRERLDASPPAIPYDKWVEEAIATDTCPEPEGGVFWMEYAIQWPEHSDHDGDGWFMNSSRRRIIDELAHAPEGSRLLARQRYEWRKDGAPRRTWRIVLGPWTPSDLTDEEVELAREGRTQRA
jgi:hypothetical protein